MLAAIDRVLRYTHGKTYEELVADDIKNYFIYRFSHIRY